jgi:hypothetical protein
MAMDSCEEYPCGCGTLVWLQPLINSSQYSLVRFLADGRVSLQTTVPRYYKESPT